VTEDASTTPRRRLILNAKDEVIATLPVPKDYDPACWVREQHPELYAERTAASSSAYREWMEALFDGSRFVMEYELIDQDNLLKLVLKESVESAFRAQTEVGGGGMMMMSWGGGSVTNLQFVDISLADTNGTMTATAAYPDGFTNRISLIVCTNLVEPDWSLLLTTNPPVSTNAFTYMDMDATNYEARFYHAYNADYDGDGDGVSNGEEIFLDGTDPANSNDPPNVKGTIFYNGMQTGTIYVVAVTSSNSWATNYSAALAQPGSYVIPKLPVGTYWIKAWRDHIANGVTNLDTEAWAVSATSLTVTGQVKNVNLTLNDPDSDGDQLPDWWEVLHFGNPSLAGPTSDNDIDALNNLSEYLIGADPNDSDSDNDLMSDGTEIARGQDPMLPPTGYTQYAALTFTEGFETPGVTVGDLNGKNRWTAAPAGRVTVQTNNTHGGAQAIHFASGSGVAEAEHLIGAAGAQTVWIDLYSRVDKTTIPRYGNHPAIQTVPRHVASVFAMNADGDIYAYSGPTNGWVKATAAPLANNVYHRYTVKQNYAQKTWDLYIDSSLATNGLGFRDPATTEFSSLSVTGARGAGTYCDDVQVSTTKPAGIP
jgi:hypothetical protein